MVKVVALIPVDDGKRWAEMFQNPKDLTVDDVLDVTVKKGLDIDRLIWYLSFRPEHSGILKEVTEEFLERVAKEYLPEAIVLSDLFAQVLSGEAAKAYTDIDAANAWDRLYESLEDIEKPDFEQLVSPQAYALRENAIISYTSFGLEKYEWALDVARYIFSEKSIPFFAEEVEARNPEASLSAVEATRIVAEILLQKSIARTVGGGETFSA